MADPLLRIKREQLATFCPDHDTIKQFERLFSLVNQTQSSSAEDALFVAETALARINSLQVPAIADVSESALLVAETALANSNNAIAISDENDFWKRNGTTLKTKFANDDLQIDSFVRVNGSSDTQQLIIKGHSTQTKSLQEWQNSSAVLQANITNSGAFRNYNTYTDASNYEAGAFTWDTNILKLKTEALGTGIVRPIEIQGAGTTIMGYASTDVPLTVKGSTSQSANLQEFKNSAGSTLTSFSNTGKLIFSNAGLIDFGNWTLSEAGVTLYYMLSGGTRAVVQNGLHAGYGWELSWINTSNSNRFGFTSPSEGYVELRGTKNITTSPMSLSVYNTYTDSSNYERAVFDWKTTSNVLTIGTQALGTGTVRPIEIASTTKIKALRETKVTSSATETVSVDITTYIDIDTSGNTLSLSDMVDGTKMQVHNSSGGNATLNFDIRLGTSTFTAPVTMPDGDSYELVYDSGSSTWVM